MPLLRPPRFLVAWLPGFRLERCGWEPQDRVVLVGEVKNAPRVLCATPPLARAGIVEGLTLAAARALAPDLQVEWLDPAGEGADLEDLALQLRRVSPATRALPPDAVAADLTPLGPRPPDLEAEGEALRRIRDRLRELGHRARVVVAEDLAGARLLAAWGRRDQVVPPGGLRGALAPLPVGALGLSPRLVALFRDLGLATVGDLAAFSPAAVSGRFGEEGRRLHRLARGGGGEGWLQVAPEEDGFSLVQDLPFPVDGAEALRFVLNRMVQDLCAALEAHGRALNRLVLDLRLDEAGSTRLAFRTGRPTRDPRRLSRLLARRLEGISLAAPVVEVVLAAEGVAPYSGAQERLLHPDGTPAPPGATTGEALGPVLARLADALGPEALLLPGPVDRWRPEAAWRPVPVVGERGPTLEERVLPGADPPVHPSPDKDGRKEADPAWPHTAWRLTLPLPRPALLLAEPRPVDLERRGGRVARLRLEGRWFPVRAVATTERLQGEWWEDPFDRTYLTLELEDGRRLWVYEELGHAFLHGLFDQGVEASWAGAQP